MLRRPFSIPFPHEVPLLARLIAGKTVGTPSDDERLLAAALFHGATAYLAEAVRQGRVTLGEHAGCLAVASHLGRAVAARRLRRELVEIMPVLEAACGAPPVVIKGPAVANGFYPHPDLRPFNDLDIVVPASRLKPAALALERAFGYGYEPEPWPGYGERFGCHRGMSRARSDGWSLVELHWRVGEDPVAAGLDHRWLLDGSHELTLETGSIRVPSIDRHLLVLAVHLLHENGKRLASINDLVLVARTASESHWLATFERARELGLGWVLHRALDHAAHHLDLDRPRPDAVGDPPPWGPFRANERFDGWTAFQVGQLVLGDWRRRREYLRAVIHVRMRRAWEGVRSPSRS